MVRLIQATNEPKEKPDTSPSCLKNEENVCSYELRKLKKIMEKKKIERKNRVL